MDYFQGQAPLPAFMVPDVLSRMPASWGSYKMGQPIPTAPTLTVHHLSGRSDARSTTSATMRVRSPAQGSSAGRTTTRAALTYHVERARRKRDEEILFLLEAA